MAKAKKTSIVIRLMSQAGTGYFYTLRKNIKSNPEKCAAAVCWEPCVPMNARPATRVDARCSPLAWHRLSLIKYDPRVNQHVLFKEEKIKK